MTGLKTILAAVALAAIFSTPGDAQKVGKVNFPASSPTDVSHHALQSARLALVIGNSSYPDADAPWRKPSTTHAPWRAPFAKTLSTLTSFRKPPVRTWHARSRVSKRKYGPI